MCVRLRARALARSCSARGLCHLILRSFTRSDLVNHGQRLRLRLRALKTLPRAAKLRTVGQARTERMLADCGRTIDWEKAVTTPGRMLWKQSPM